MSNKKWFVFFHNINIKQHLLTLFVTYLYPDNFVHSSPLSIPVNNNNEIFKISSSVTKVFECKQEEADTRIILYASQQKADVFACSKYSDVLVLWSLLMLLGKLMRSS